MLLLLTSVSFADEILTGEQTIHRVQILDYDAGTLKYRTPAGDYHELLIHQIDYLVLDSITGVADFNEAEAYLLKGQPHQAVERYERAMRSARGFWAEMVQVRLLGAADRAGFFAKTVPLFLTVAKREPATAAHLFPIKFPNQPSKATARTLKKIEEALAGNTKGEARLLAELLQYEMLRKLSDPQAIRLAPIIAIKPIPPALVTPRTVAIKSTALNAILQAGNFADAVSAIDAMIVTIPETYLPEFLLLKARALYAAAETDDDYLEAALPAMRVAIHYTDHAVACEGLLLAAAAHEASGRVSDAVHLLRVCLGKREASEDARKRVREKLKQLTRSDASSE